MLILLGYVAAGHGAQASCGDVFAHEVRVLRSETHVDLCERYQGHPVLVVNTASHCGYTPQFKQLESLYQAYQSRGLRIAGFPSNDFRQESNDEATTATVCFVNYGVTFDMYAPVRVAGDSAHPVFKSLAAARSAPMWNFHKYLIDREGKVVADFPSHTAPTDSAVTAALESVL